jgi:hypothetical protein
VAFEYDKGPPGRPDEALLFVGDDAYGTKLEVMGVELPMAAFA